jgi:hypothetical protein
MRELGLFLLKGFEILNKKKCLSNLKLHLLCVGWRNFFPVMLLCQFLVLAGNRFWFYILLYLEYNTVVMLC